MRKKEIVNSFGESQIVDFTAQEEAELQDDIAKSDEKKVQEDNAKQIQQDLKASAKAKLMSGEALTEDEANTIVL